ncbi:MAG: hypothetical protein V1794_14405 [Candidatus Glassbacteria bacterium]
MQVWRNRIPALILALAVAGCSKEEQRNVTDFIPHLDATVIDYRSETFFVSGTVPTGQDLSPGQAGSHTSRIAPVIVGISLGGYNLVEIKDAKVRLKLQLAGVDFDGAASVRLYIGNGVDIYNDPSAVKALQKLVLPAIFDITTADSKLRQIFAQREVVFGLEFTTEPTKIASHQISLQGHIDQFEAEITGVTGIF